MNTKNSFLYHLSLYIYPLYSIYRPAYGSDGDYFSKPSREDLFRAVYDMLHEADPARYPEFF